ncbi:hypothetical protein RDWZM_003197 [Blomia tropicalis]|uniref:Uncharacterized protein n=1 Tax=Blomia tropicalis TaxID=40697 RepID=A0A9Q0MHQ9_BLOTA|nr:hypothetical protein RDWZM_003197 [Blomia tropicalis]
MALGEDKPKLSLLAQFDDHIRLLEAFSIANNENFDGCYNLFDDYEHNRKKWVNLKRELIEKQNENTKLKEELKLLNSRLQTIRFAYAREMKSKSKLQRDYNDLRDKLNIIQNLIKDDGNQRSDSQNSQVLSVLDDLNHKFNLKPAINDSHESDDGLLFDKSDDTLEDMDTDNHRAQPKMARIESDCAEIDFTSSKSTTTPITTEPNYAKIAKRHSVILEKDEESILNTCFISTDEEKNEQTVIPASPVSSVDAPKDEPIGSFLPHKPFSTTTLTNRKCGKLLTKFNMMRSVSKLETDRLNSRPHTFQKKKLFKPLSCIPCGNTIGFCGNCLICVDCRSIVHDKCKHLLPKPCVPYVVSGAGLRKMLSSTSSSSQMIMISDFCSKDVRPSIPALLIHCCNELDRRIELAVNDPKLVINKSDCSLVEGLYRVCGADREVRELRSKILDGKNGMPNLEVIADSAVICDTIKTFLKDLDDPLVTRVLWNEFVRASEKVEQCAHEDDALTDSDYNSNGDCQLDLANDEWHESLEVLKSIIIQLPNPNRDSLAFLFLHFIRIIHNEKVTKMNSKSLSKILAPTIVGNASRSSYRSTPNQDKLIGINQSIIEQNLKQITVMKALFRLSKQFWEGLLKDLDFCPLKNPEGRVSVKIGPMPRKSNANILDYFLDEKKSS